LIPREVWFYVYQALGQNLPQQKQSTITWWRQLRSTRNGEQKAGMDSLFALVSWYVWKERNARCFREAASTAFDLIQIIHAEAQRWIEAGANGLASLAPGN